MLATKHELDIHMTWTTVKICRTTNCNLWISSSLLQTNVIISADILWKHFNVFNNPSKFLYV
jgi:hypothetical protein